MPTSRDKAIFVLTTTTTTTQPITLPLAHARGVIKLALWYIYIAHIIITRDWPARDCSSATKLKFGRNTVLSSLSL